MTTAALNVTDQADGTKLLVLSGDWTIHGTIPPEDPVSGVLESATAPRAVAFDTTGLTDWDSRLVTILARLVSACTERHIEVSQEGLPDGMQGLLHLAFAVPEREGARRTATRASLLANFGEAGMKAFDDLRASVPFVGQVFIAFQNFIRGRARYRAADLWVTVQEAGAEALPIVSLISFLVGVILAFVGAVQLEQFGADIYVANLVGLAMVREMGAMMTAIIMAGRTGAAFAAQLGTMMVNEEIDALETLGIPPMEFLVLPRILALMVMMPLLCIYSDLLGILGGMLIGVSMMDLGAVEYVVQTRSAISLGDCAGGLFKAVVYGAIVALAGCMEGMRCGRSAAAVGISTTSAVVKAITLIVVACAILTVTYNVIGI